MEVSFRRAVAEARRQKNLYFASLLSEERIDEAFGIARAVWQGWVYTLGLPTILLAVLTKWGAGAEGR